MTWFDEHKRPLPWRKTYEPYQVWISEVMLQQTQISRGVPFFERWLKRFPDAASVAAAPIDDVLKHWEGLGYYSRARNIHKAASVIMERHGGCIPNDFEAVSALPGIGRYTAGAIMSFAFNQPYPIVEANIERLFARLLDRSEPTKSKPFQELAWRKAEELIPPGQARCFNQALMELGAIRCLSRSPRCGDCPATPHCLARARGTVHLRPAAKLRKASTPLAMAAGVLVHEGLVLVRRRPPGGLMPLLWELPSAPLIGDTPQDTLRRLFRQDLGLQVDPETLLATVRHGFTRYACTLTAYLCRLRSAPETVPSEARWLTIRELDDLTFNSGQRRIVNLLARTLPLGTP